MNQTLDPTDTTKETCWIVTGADGKSDRKLHADEECRLLQSADNYRETSRDTFPSREICKICRGDVDLHRGGSRGPHKRLKAIGEERGDRS